MAMLKSFSGRQLAKRPWKKVTDVNKKEKILGKLLMGKEAKGFDQVECCIKNATIDEEYNSSFPLGFALAKDVRLLVD
jgi:hypothetical protein